MDKAKQEKIQRFLADKGMSEAIYEVLLKAFLKPREGDVHIQASKSISIDNLGEAWKELEKFKQVAEVESKIGKQIGL